MNDKLAAKVFKRLPTDARRALYLGDLEITDVVDEELSFTEKESLTRLVKRWGLLNGVDGS